MTRLTRLALLLALLCGALLAQSPPFITPTVQTLTAFVNEPYSQQFGVGGLPVGATVQSWAITGGALPAGLTLNTASGLVTGTPTTPTETYITITATYNTAAASGLIVSATYVFYTDYRNTFITPAVLAPATAGLSVTRLMTVTQSSSWTVVSSNLPTAIVLQPIGGDVPVSMQLSGVFPAVATPTTYTFTLSALYEGMVTSTATRTFSILVNPAPALSGTLPSGRVGTAYNSALPFSGGTAPITFSITSGTLPPGLLLNSSSGVISGTPTTANTYSFAARAADANGAISTRSYSILVQPPLLVITSGTPGEGVVGQSYGFTFTSTGGSPPSTWSVSSGSLPPGLSLAPGGLLSGTPTAAGLYSYTVTAADSQGQTASGVYAQLIRPAPLVISTTSLPGGVVGSAYASRIVVSGGTTPYNFAILAGALPPGVLLAADGGLSGTPTTAGTFSFTAGVNDSGQQTASRSYSIVVQPPPLIITSGAPSAGIIGQAYSFAFAGTGGSPPYTWTVSSGSLPHGLTLAVSGQLSGTPTTAGQDFYTVTLTDTQGQTASGTYTHVIRPAPLVISTTSLPDGLVGTAYATRIAPAGGTTPYRVYIVNGALPPGLSLAADGALSGTPTAAGTFNFTAGADDSGQQTASRLLAITVAGNPAPLAISTATLPVGLPGTAYSSWLAASGGVSPYTFSVTGGSLPTGLSISPGGEIAGTPQAAGSFSFTATVTDSRGTRASKDFTLSVAAPLRFTTATLPGAAPNATYVARLDAAGGTPPYAFSIVSGNLPPGIRLGADGVFGGTPTASGTFTFTARVADSARGNSDGVFVIVVQERPSITTTTLPGATAGTAYTATLAGTGQSPLSWSVSSGALPPGLVLAAATGILSGTPTAAGSYSFTITLTDSQRLTATRDFTLQVALPALPALNISQLPTAAAPSSQPAFSLALAQAYPLALSGTATLRFTPDSGLPADPDVRFASGGTTLNFTIPAGQTAAVPASGLFAFQAGTTAGTITLTVTLRQGSTTITPDPFITRTLRVDRAAPGISSVRINRTATGFEVLVTGYSNTREISGATFTFTPASGSTLATSTFTVAVQPVFQTWFAGAGSQTYGGQFLLTVPFTTSNTSALASVSVTLTNAAGSATGSANF